MMEIQAGQLIQYLIQAVIILLLVLLMKMLKNGGPRITAERLPAAEEPGKAEICIERGEQLQRHETELEHLIKDLDEEKEDRKKFHKDMLDKVGSIFKEIRKMNGSK